MLWGAQRDRDPVILGVQLTELGLKPDLLAGGSVTSGEAPPPLCPGKRDWMLPDRRPFIQLGFDRQGNQGTECRGSSLLWPSIHLLAAPSVCSLHPCPSASYFMPNSGK